MLASWIIALYGIAIACVIAAFLIWIYEYLSDE